MLLFLIILIKLWLIILFTSIVGAPVGIASTSLTLFFSLTTGTVKKLLNITRNKEKKHEKILMLDKSKVNSIKTLISKAFIDMEKSQVQFWRRNINMRKWKII